jgi:hypothetical protein
MLSQVAHADDLPLPAQQRASSWSFALSAN